MRDNKNNRIRLSLFLVGFLFIFSLFSLWTSQRLFASDEPLVVTDVAHTITSTGHVSISWMTNKLSTSLVEFSIDDSFSQRAQIEGFATDRSVVLPLLTPNALYHYHVVSITPEGERVVGPHILFYSPTQENLKISQLQFGSDFHWYDLERPLLGAQGLELQISNLGQVPVTEHFSLSFLLSQVTKGDSYDLGYSCFAQYEHQRTLPGETTETLLLDSDILAHCDPLVRGTYTLTAAIDYDDQVIEADETDNVFSIEKIVEDHDLATQFVDVSSSKTQASSTIITFFVQPKAESPRVVIDVAPDYYIADHPSMYLWTQDTTVASSTYSVLVQGLQEETLYHYRLRFLDSNATSGDYTFRTTKDLNADANRLLSLKRIDPTCRVIQGKPLGTSYWQDLGLNLPEHNMLRYRILWSSGNWSPWYIPGSGDEDWQPNEHQNPRRVWSYFQDHNFEYETCLQDIPHDGTKNKEITDQDVAKAQPQLPEEKYDRVINRGHEASDQVTKRKIENVQRALRFYRSKLSPTSWQTIQDAYVYGGYRLSEIEQTLRHDIGTVHPTIPAVAWRRQLTAKTAITVINH